MKPIAEVLSTILFFAFCLGIVFLLQGSPSVWDTLRAAAIGSCK